MHALRLAGMKRAQNGLKEPQNLAQIFILFAGHSKFTNGAFWSHLFLWHFVSTSLTTPLKAYYTIMKNNVTIYLMAGTLLAIVVMQNG